MSVLNPGQAFAGGVLGLKVDRATDTLPQTADEALFTIAGGRVAITAILGEVTTVIQTQINNTKLKFNPDATGADADLCAVLDISADAVGTLYSITGTPATALQDSLLFLPPNKGLANPVIVSEGALELDCAASNTGSVAWTIYYVPVDSGATVVAA